MERWVVGLGKRARAVRPGPSPERHVGERPVTAALAAIALALAYGAHSAGAAARTAVLLGVLAYVALVLLAEVVHLDDRL